MELLNDINIIIERVDKYKNEFTQLDFEELTLVIKNISPECLEKLSKHYADPEKRAHIFSPTNYAPYNWFRVKISEHFNLEFRGEEFEVDTKTIYKSKS